MKKNDLRKDILAALLINPLPDFTRLNLYLDEKFCDRLGLEPMFWYPLSEHISVETESLHNAFRAAWNGRKTASLALKDGGRVRAKLGKQKGGKATLLIQKEGFAFSNADLLSSKRQERRKALARLFNGRPLAPKEEEAWRAIVEDRPLSDREYDELMTTSAATPEAFWEELSKPQELDSNTLMPNDPAYYERLVGKLENSRTLEAYVGDELAAFRVALMKRHPSRALRRVALTALWQRLIPFDLFASLEPSDLSPLLNAEDPFSLLFGFEICRARIDGNASFIDFGTQFLEKLFGDPEKGNARLEIYAACAIIATNEIRRLAKATNKPLFWIRLAALTHAGVLAQGLGGLPNPKEFLNWAVDNFFPKYVWTTVVDRHEAPRWKPEWISPDHLMAELFGRAQNALHSLPENLRPTPWVALFEKVSAPLIESGRILAAVFPGPFDDFHEGPMEGLRSEQFEDIENQLERATHLTEFPGRSAFAFAMQPSEKATKNMLRILTSTFEQPVRDTTEELSHLQIASHFALISRSEEIADAIKSRAFALLYDAKGLDLVTDLFSVIAEACAVKRDASQYRQALGKAATRMCFAIDETEALSKLLLIFDVLNQSDEKLVPALAKAKAVAKTKIGRS